MHAARLSLPVYGGRVEGATGGLAVLSDSEIIGLESPAADDDEFVLSVNVLTLGRQFLDRELNRDSTTIDQCALRSRRRRDFDFVPHVCMRHQRRKPLRLRST